jgi:hypothetical protein
MIFAASIPMRLAKSFMVEPEVNEYVDATKENRSTSERVNELLKRAILEEQYDRLDAEAAAFFAESRSSRRETREFQKAALRAFDRD